MAFVDRFENIETDRIINIRRVKVDDIVDAVRGNAFDHVFGKVAVRIDDPHAMAGVNVGHHHVLDHCRLAHAGFSDNVNVPAAVVGLDPEFARSVPEIRRSERDHLVLVVVIVRRKRHVDRYLIKYQILIFNN